MYLAYLIVSALELLNVLEESMTNDERAGYINWIYHCQHPCGGFRMWPGTDFGVRSSNDNAKWDPAHVPATYFALTTLLTLGDDLDRVDHQRTLEWLRTMQRTDGSFGETMINGQIEGGNDPRFTYCATGCRYILRSQCTEGSIPSDDFDIAALVRSICDSQVSVAELTQ